MQWMIQAHFASPDQKWREIETFETREAAEAHGRRLGCDDYCYLIELWQHAGCLHAVG
ncbi:hypothetical protein [Methylorubrum populi]|uniref:Uncharacterized protein n=1 Tax=Methylorubrum populi TaxID=223967 RepID=A0A833N217_9HYPH|nr:hypothetical protein [Methylorubrum populi]KAB7788081.1 hypothetical protein F8B43_0086 [Methylorubrum populi]